MGDSAKFAGEGFFIGLTEAIEKLTKYGEEKSELKNKAQIVTVNGNSYLYDPCGRDMRYIDKPLPADDPSPDTLSLYTLDGLIDYIKENPDGLIPSEGDPLIVHVFDETEVYLRAKLTEHRKVRPVLAMCHATVPKVVFGQHMSVEDFNVMLLSKFVQTEPLKKLFEVSSKLCKEQSLNVADDGVSQGITIKSGASLASNVVFHNPVPLCPIRTFHEIEQPESNFTFRVDGDARPALFEADGGFWRNEAVARIGEYLRSNLAGCNVVVLA